MAKSIDILERLVGLVKRGKLKDEDLGRLLLGDKTLVLQGGAKVTYSSPGLGKNAAGGVVAIRPDKVMGIVAASVLKPAAKPPAASVLKPASKAVATVSKPKPKSSGL